MFTAFKHRQLLPVFCYHSMNADTTDYFGNDHIALKTDLALLEKHHYHLIGGIDVVNFVTGNQRYQSKEKVACISIDDAPILDYHDYDSPTIGHIDSFRKIITQSKVFKRSKARILNFAIVDEKTRELLDIICIQGNGDWSSSWWKNAIDEQLYDIANHSFDHMHDALETSSHSRGEKGNFYAVDNYLDADKQIRQAYEQLQQTVGGKATPLFGYPYGHTNDYLVNDYFPNYQPEHQQLGAFTTAGEYVTTQSNRWAIPRFVCGQHWQTPEQFERILLDAN